MIRKLNFYPCFSLNFLSLFYFLFWLCVLDKAEYSAFESTLNSSIISYRIVSLEVKLKRLFICIEAGWC